MADHQHMLDGKNRPVTLEELKKFVDAASMNDALGKRPLHVEISSGKLKKIWIDLSSSDR
ncbi:hypothetical protein [Streptomyces acidiscabies]|uniref:hypothetical protein n=1 Tax=Streptomyces acidiscabies TaxID=42234 RepID=UPI0009514D93|nr:hypothetical protein [Streptomyces acidiscabies]